MYDLPCRIGELLFCVVRKNGWTIEACTVCCVEICDDHTTITAKSVSDGKKYIVQLGVDAFRDVREAANKYIEKKEIKE